MDGARFDAWAKAVAGGASRRRVLAGLGALAVGLLGRGAAGQEVGVATCRQRLDNSHLRDQSSEAAEGHRIGSARLSEFCFGGFRGARCCGEGGARCSDSCDCCDGHGCRDGACRPLEACRANSCCDCLRRNEVLFCGTRLATPRECFARCERLGADYGSFAPADGATYACGARGCREVCPRVG